MKPFFSADHPNFELGIIRIILILCSLLLPILGNHNSEIISKEKNWEKEIESIQKIDGQYESFKNGDLNVQEMLIPPLQADTLFQKSDIYIDTELTLSPNETLLTNLDNLLSTVGIEGDNYQFSNIVIKNVLSFEAEIDSSTLDNAPCSIQFLPSVVQYVQFPNIENYLIHSMIQLTNIHVFITKSSIVFVELNSDNKTYQQMIFQPYNFINCWNYVYYTKDRVDGQSPNKFILFDCDQNPTEGGINTNYNEVFVILNLSSVATLTDISQSLISILNQQIPQICQKRSLSTTAFLLSENSSILYLLIQFCQMQVPPPEKSETPFIYIQEILVDSQTGTISFNPRQVVQVGLQSDTFEGQIQTVGTDVALSNLIYLFFSQGQVLIYTINLTNAVFSLQNGQQKRVYDTDFSTVKFLLTYNKNLLIRKNYLMFTSTATSKGSLYILEITDENQMEYVQKKILIPNHLVEQTIVIRDFIVIIGCLNPTSTLVSYCSEIPSSMYVQYLAVFNSKESRQNVQFYKKFPPNESILIDSITNNYILNSILTINQITGEIVTYQIMNNYLEINSYPSFTTESQFMISYTLTSSNLIQDLPDVVLTRFIKVNFMQNKQTLQLTNNGQDLFSDNFIIKNEDLFFSVQLNDKIIGPQIDYFTIKEEISQQLYNLTISNQLSYDLLLDQSGIYSQIPYKVLLTHVTNANVNQIIIFTQFNMTQGYDILSQICTLSSGTGICVKQDFMISYKNFITSLQQWTQQVYVGVEQPDLNQPELQLVVFFMGEKKSKALKTTFTNISSVHVIDSNNIGVLQENLNQIIIIQGNFTSIIGSDIGSQQIDLKQIAQIQINFTYQKILKFCMKFFATQSLILIHTSDNIVRVGGVFWRKGYANTQFRMSMNIVSTLQLTSTDACQLNAFSYPKIMFACIDTSEKVQIYEYSLDSNKQLSLTRTLSTYQFHVYRDQLTSSWTDNVFFYQPGYRIGMEDRDLVFSLLIFDPHSVTRSALISTVDMTSFVLTVPFSTNTLFGSYLIYNTKALPSVKEINRIKIISINSNPSINFTIIPQNITQDFGLSFYAASNYTESSIFRHIEISTDLSHYVIQGQPTDLGWHHVNRSRFLQLDLPESAFQGPVRSISIANYHGSSSNFFFPVSEFYTQQSGNTTLQKNLYYISVNQMITQTSAGEENLDYVGVQKNNGQIIDSVYFKPDNTVVTISQKLLLIMSAQNKTNNSVNVTTTIFENFPLDYNYANCRIYHHKKWRFFLIFCRSDATDFLYQFTYNLSNEIDPKTQQIKLTGLICKQTSILIEKQGIGYIQNILLSENVDTTEFDVKTITIFFISYVDRNYAESMVKVSKFDSTGTVLSVLYSLDARSFNLRTLSIIDSSIISFVSEMSSSEVYLLSLISKISAIFTIIAGSPPAMFMRTSINLQDPSLPAASNTDETQLNDLAFLQTIDLINVSFSKVQLNGKSTPCLKIAYILQYERSNAKFSQLQICSQAGSQTKNYMDWIILTPPSDIQVYQHYKACQQYKSSPIVYWGNSIEINQFHPPMYFARVCSFNEPSSLSSIQSQTLSMSFHLILFTNKRTMEATQTITELPFFSGRPSSIFLYSFNATNSTSDIPVQKTHMLITSYLNLYIDFIVEESYQIIFYFKQQQPFALSKKQVNLLGVNDHFSSISVLRYNIIDYSSIIDSKQDTLKMIIMKSSIFFFTLLFYIVPLLKVIYKPSKKLQKRQSRLFRSKINNKSKNEKQQNLTDEYLDQRQFSFNGVEETKQIDDFYSNVRRGTSQFAINDNDNDSENEYD